MLLFLLAASDCDTPWTFPLTFLISVEMSFIYKKNNKGPRTVPCGTSDKTRAQSDFTAFTTTRCYLKHKKESIHFNIFPPIP